MDKNPPDFLLDLELTLSRTLILLNIKEGTFMFHKDKVWFITGCSTGFGRAIAEKASAAGYKVVATARNKDTLTHLLGRHELDVLTLELDVRKKEQVEDSVNQAIARFGRIDVLVNNAGIGYFSSVEDSIEEETRKMFEINFWGLMSVTRTVLPHMRSQKSGHIINFSSIGGVASFPIFGYYHATKYAVEGISETLAQEVKPFNIKVTLIEPSAFRTDWAGRSAVKTESSIPEYGEFLRLWKESHPLGQEPGDPARAAEAIITVVETENPPLHLLLGDRAYQVAKRKFADMLQSIEKWGKITLDVEYNKH